MTRREPYADREVRSFQGVRVSAPAPTGTSGCMPQGGSTEVGEARRGIYVGGGEDRTYGWIEQEQ